MNPYLIERLDRHADKIFQASPVAGRNNMNTVGTSVVPDINLVSANSIFEFSTPSVIPSELIAINRNGITIKFEIERAEQSTSPAQIRVITTNANSDPIENFTFQAAVTKVLII